MTVSRLPPDGESRARLIRFPGRTGREPLWPKKMLAEYLYVSERTIERWTADGLPCVRFRRTVRYRPSDVEAWLARAEA